MRRQPPHVTARAHFGARLGNCRGIAPTADNCDAHGKTFSLLYDSGSPTLAPLYDLVSTVVYPDLVTRLAMSIDGATQIADVDGKTWSELAAQVGVRRDFAIEAVERIAGCAAAAAQRVAVEQGTGAAKEIAERVVSLSADVLR